MKQRNGDLSSILLDVPASVRQRNNDYRGLLKMKRLGQELNYMVLSTAFVLHIYDFVTILKKFPQKRIHA
ncbi:hypothetical protein H5410_012429 [Solanum commersonii]|uniref:Uncharacterized protein n=1 Tax=Solanum commersonii TaxID=4109 RepID=A0A9J6ASE3_SOLCO|nr:hypothetical protein H5410_012429 [Solanum commersonii]